MVKGFAWLDVGTWGDSRDREACVRTREFVMSIRRLDEALPGSSTVWVPVRFKIMIVVYYNRAKLQIARPVREHQRCVPHHRSARVNHVTSHQQVPACCRKR
jgi:hypothetical protein